MKNGWQVRTDHFLVTTNHSLEAAAELAARLERLYQVWRQLFAGFYLTRDGSGRGLFAGDRESRTQARPFRVFYHRDRDEYANALRRRQPRIDETLGIYFDTIREAHFFADERSSSGSPAPPQGPPSPRSTTRPCTNCSRNRNRRPSKSAPPRISGSSKASPRISKRSPNIRTRTRVFTSRSAKRPPAGCPPRASGSTDGFYIPLAELTRLGKDDVQRHADIAKLYSQSSGLAAFLIDGEQGRYREPLVRYLQAVYAGRDNEASLADADGT